ncbi:MAG: fibronectin type III domain-containing protein, partial [Elusimicrobiota bacterium]
MNQVTASTVPAGGLSYTFSGLTSSTLYYFQVRAVNHNGLSAPAAAYVQLGSTQTLALPAPVIGSVTSATANSLSADWQLVDAATGYTLAASVNAANPPSPVYASSTTLGGLSLSATLGSPALATNASYYLFVRANGAGESSSWAAYPATYTLANVPLSAASTFSAIGYYGFSVSWDNNSNPLGTTLYTVQVSTAYNFNDGATNQVTQTTAPAAGPMYSFDALTAGTYYYFRVRARNNGGVFTDWTELGSVQTKAEPVPHSPGDGVVFYGQASATPQFRTYSAAGNSFSTAVNVTGDEDAHLFVIKTNPLSTKQEAMAGYVKNGTLYVFCTDGANWTQEWTQTVGGTEATRRFDIAYETNSGDVMVLYSKNSATMGYRTKPGASDCGSDWSAPADLAPAMTSGVVQWVKMASDRRADKNIIAAIWADASSDLSAKIWTGTAWENEPSPALATTLDVVASAQDVEDFDVDFESNSGDLMVVWGKVVGNNANGVMAATATYTGGSPLHTWGTAYSAPGFLDGATNLDLAANPDPASNEMAFASIDFGTQNLQKGRWDGGVWVSSANAEPTCATPAAGTKLVAVGWLTSGGLTKSVVAYNDAGATNIGWGTGYGVTFSSQPDFSPTPAFGSPQKVYDMQQDPVNKDRLILTVSDVNSDLFAKRLVMDSASNFTWTNADSGALQTALTTPTVNG